MLALQPIELQGKIFTVLNCLIYYNRSRRLSHPLYEDIAQLPLSVQSS